MILLPLDLRAKLLANRADHGSDHVPLLKLFNPIGAATWLASELYEDGNTLFGLADLGFGCPEMGTFSLTEIASVSAVAAWLRVTAKAQHARHAVSERALAMCSRRALRPPSRPTRHSSGKPKAALLSSAQFQR